MVLPKRLKKGDKVGIVSPSAAITRELKPQLKRGMKFLRDYGFSVELGKNVMAVEDSSAGTSKQRADDINSMFSNEEISAIICSQGGGTANTCLPLLDFDLIRKNPKIFLGISDITVLLNSIFKKTGLVTFHGNDVMWGFGRKPTEYDKREFSERLLDGRIGRVNKNSEWKTIRAGSGEGRLIGGNVNCIRKLLGTEFQPRFEDSVLFLEAFEITTDDCKCVLSQLQQSGAFDKLRGILIGYIWGLQASSKRRMSRQMEEIVVEMTGDYGFPIVKCDDFGHNCPNTTLPLGTRVKLDAHEGLEILEPCVV